MHLVIKEHKPRHQTMLLLAGLIVSGIFIWAVFNREHLYGWLVSVKPSEQTGIATGNDESELARLENRIAVLQRLAKVDKRAYAQVQETINNLQRQNLKLKRELEFYRQAIKSTESGRGVSVQGFRVEQLDKPYRYRFELVLTHLVKSDTVADGTISVVFEGSIEGVRKRISLVEVAEAESTEFAFNIKHFRRLQGIFNLPHGFFPEHVHVVVHANGSKVASVERVFEWATLLAMWKDDDKETKKT